jgi:hypothetical protein
MHEIQHRDLQGQCETRKKMSVWIPRLLEEEVPQKSLRSGVHYTLKPKERGSSFTVHFKFSLFRRAFLWIRAAFSGYEKERFFNFPC